MPNRLVACAASTLCLSAVFAVLLNYECEPLVQDQRQLSFNEIKNTEQSNWQNILLTLPQYKKPERALTEQELAAQEALFNVASKEITISDSQLIGIILDKPRSVLLSIRAQSNLEPVQLILGQSWLADWQLSKINADSAIWFNTQTQQSYTQWLFSYADQTIDSLNTTSNEMN